MSGPFWCRCLAGTHGFGPQASRRIRRQADRPRRTARTRLYLEPLETRVLLSFSLGNAANYGILTSPNIGNNSVQLTSDTFITGNIGIANTGGANQSSPQLQGAGATVHGDVDFAGNINITNTTVTGTTTANVAAVNTAFSTVSTLSANLGTETGTSLTLTGSNQTINVDNTPANGGGTPDASGNLVYTASGGFQPSSGATVTINGSATDYVVINVPSGEPFKLSGEVDLSGGITEDHVLYNVLGIGQIGGAANGETIHGDIVAINRSFNVDNVTIDGRIIGGDSANFQLVSNFKLNAPPSQVTPTITTAPNPAAVTLGTSSVTLKDTADLEGGNSPTGTITFTLYQSSTLEDTETATVNGNGNGTYTTPTGFTLPTNTTVTGTYQWDATYNGNGNNNTVSDTNATNEQVTVTKASPTLSTTPSPTSITLSNATPPVLTDSATLAGGYHETGTITFTLFLGSTLVDTETVTVSGNGTYSTPTGYTLPTTGTVTGTYQWDASYNGDGNNNTVSDTNATNEQVTVTSASPTLSTTPSPTAVTLSSSTPPKLTDSATLSGGYFETGTITFTLHAPTALGGGVVDTETATVSGNGTYSTPTGYTLPTTGTVTGTYRWDASYNGDGNNNTVSDTNATNEQVTVTSASPTLSTTPSPTSITLSNATPLVLTDSATLSGGYFETGTITFTLHAPTALGGGVVDTETATVSGNGTYSTPTGYTLPTTGTVTGTYRWDASYNGDGNNNTVSDTNATNEQVTVTKASPTLSTTPSPTSITLSNATPPVLTDSATLSGGYHETGTITFTLFLGSTLVDTETVTVSGNGTYTTPTGYTLPTTGTVTGTYQWDASYNGDGNNNTVSDTNATNEQVTVTSASPTLSTTPSPTAVTLSSSTPPKLTDSATLSGGYFETGTITFTLHAPTALGGGVVDTETATVSGNGTYSTPTGYTLPTTGTVTGTYQWNASYNGDGNNNTVSDTNATNEQVTVTSASPTLSTTPSPTSITLSNATPLVLTDSATLSGGYFETGTITFTLHAPTPWAAAWWTRRRPRSAATAPTARRPATRCRPRAR